MRRLISYRRTLLFLGLLALLGGALWWQHRPLLAWYYTRALATAPEEERATWVDRLVALDEAAVPALVAQVRSDNPDGATAALSALVEKWGGEDARSLRLAESLHIDFGRLDPASQRCVVQLFSALLQHWDARRLPVPLTRAAGEVLQAATVTGFGKDVLALAAALIERVPPGQWLQPCRELARRGCVDPDPQVRLAAVRLILCEPLKLDPEALPRLVPLLRDPAAPVRRAALVALASARELVTEDELLPLLHDSDREVQHLCELALSSRGLQQRDIVRARLITDADPAARLRLLQHLGAGSDVDLDVWLRRLTQDTSPAVRAAAVRVAATSRSVDLRDRLRDMAERDPSETVRQNAQHYLAKQKSP